MSWAVVFCFLGSRIVCSLLLYFALWAEFGVGIVLLRCAMTAMKGDALSYTLPMSIVGNVAAIAKGMGITFKEMLEPTQVENYPDGPGPLRGAKFEQRFRGKHQLQRDEDGLEKCVACFLCAAACPSNCIFIEAAENTAEKRISSSERYAKIYNIDYNRCIFCGYCVEACPTDAITHGHGFELASLNATNLVMRKDDMLVPVSSLTAK